MINKIINLVNPDNKDLSELSKDELLELLVKLNKCLRCLDESENVLEENMLAGDLVSPTKEVQMKTLEYLTQNMSKVPDKKARATMVYYTLLNLHMFSDENEPLGQQKTYLQKYLQNKGFTDFGKSFF